MQRRRRREIIRENAGQRVKVQRAGQPSMEANRRITVGGARSILPKLKEFLHVVGRLNKVEVES